MTKFDDAHQRTLSTMTSAAKAVWQLSGKDLLQELPELFDGNAVYMTLTHSQRQRTSAENVSDVLDAIVKLIRLRGMEYRPPDR